MVFLFCCVSIVVWGQEGIIVTIAGTGIGGYSGDGGPATNAELNHPYHLWLDNFENLYIAEAYNHVIRKIVFSTGIVTTVAGNGSPGYSGDGGIATNAQLAVPQGVCTDAFGNIYVSDGINHRIRKVNITTGIITTIAGNGLVGNSGDNGPATSARLNGPIGLSIDNEGNLFLCDVENHNVRKVNSAGIISTIAGNGTAGYSGDGGPATNAQLHNPNKATVDNYGDIIISDPVNNAIRKVNATTGVISTIAGGLAGYFGDGGLAINAKLNVPLGGFIDKHNNIFFADWGNGVIRKINGTSGVINTIVGCGIQGYAGDGGAATNAKLMPIDIFIDGFGVMYIAEWSNNLVRMVYNPELESPLVFLAQEILLSPNPAQNEMTIEHAAGGEVCIYNMVGQLCGKYKLIQERQVVDISHFGSGMYLVQVIGANGEKCVRRVVKQP